MLYRESRKNGKAQTVKQKCNCSYNIKAAIHNFLLQINKMSKSDFFSTYSFAESVSLTPCDYNPHNLQFYISNKGELLYLETYFY